MYSRSAKGGEKGDPNRNPWLAKMGLVKPKTIKLVFVASLLSKQQSQRDLARNHSGPTSVKSRKCLRNNKKKSVLTPRNDREKWNTVIYYKTPTKHRH